MYKIQFFVAVVLVSILLSSCEKEIDVNINKADPVIVIEGVVANQTDSMIVKITRSGLITYTQFSPISGAVVSITEDGVNKVVLSEGSPGIYVRRNAKGSPGHTYTLNVELEGKIFNATCKMPAEVQMGSLGVSTANFFGTLRNSVTVKYEDPAGIKNYYRCKVAVIKDNPVKVNQLRTLYLFDDNFSDGKSNTQEIFNLDEDFKSNDLIGLELQCIDSLTYRYWKTISQNIFQGGASTIPANPVGNISNGALGCFSAHTQSRKFIKIP
jgi:hypothetical protein